jgi:hypothetical protein
MGCFDLVWTIVRKCWNDSSKTMMKDGGEQWTNLGLKVRNNGLLVGDNEEWWKTISWWQVDVGCTKVMISNDMVDKMNDGKWQGTTSYNEGLLTNQ